MNIKVIYGKMLTGLGKLCGVDCAKKFDTQLRFHRNLNLKNPKSLADKVTYIELHEQSPLAQSVQINMQFAGMLKIRDSQIFWFRLLEDRGAVLMRSTFKRFQMLLFLRRHMDVR